MESLLVVVLVVALVVAVAMCLFAWRVLRRDRERSDVRVARLRAMAASTDMGPEPDITPEPEPEYEPEYEPELRYQPSARLFAAPEPAPAGPRWGMFTFVVLVCMSIGAGTVYGLYGSGTSFSWPTLSASAPAASPLELLSLTHRRDPGGDFIVTGLVQNPVNGRTTSGLVAVVYLFDADGEYFASGKAAIDIPALAAGDQSPFLIRLPNITKVSRYRLGFRMNDGGVFAHVDRRGAPLAGTTAAVVEESR
jgi:hypothetical protein